MNNRLRPRRKQALPRRFEDFVLSLEESIHETNMEIEAINEQLNLNSVGQLPPDSVNQSESVSVASSNLKPKSSCQGSVEPVPSSKHKSSHQGSVEPVNKHQSSHQGSVEPAKHQSFHQGSVEPAKHQSSHQGSVEPILGPGSSKHESSSYQHSVEPIPVPGHEWSGQDGCGESLESETQMLDGHPQRSNGTWRVESGLEIDKVSHDYQFKLPCDYRENDYTPGPPHESCDITNRLGDCYNGSIRDKAVGVTGGVQFAQSAQSGQPYPLEKIQHGPSRNERSGEVVQKCVRADINAIPLHSCHQSGAYLHIDVPAYASAKHAQTQCTNSGFAPHQQHVFKSGVDVRNHHGPVGSTPQYGEHPQSFISPQPLSSRYGGPMPTRQDYQSSYNPRSFAPHKYVAENGTNQPGPDFSTPQYGEHPQSSNPPQYPPSRYGGIMATQQDPLSAENSRAFPMHNPEIQSRNPAPVQHYQFVRSPGVHTPRYDETYRSQPQMLPSQPSPSQRGEQSSILQDRHMKLMYLSTLDPVKFSGEAKDYPIFERRIRSTLCDGTLTDSEKVDLMPKFLEGRALKKLQTLNGASFDTVMRRFGETYGHPTRVAESFIKVITTGPAIKPTDRGGLQEFADLLMSATETLTGEYLIGAGCAPNVRKIMDRLPYFVRNDWEKKVNRIVGDRMGPSLVDVATFVMKHASDKNNVHYQNRDADNGLSYKQSTEPSRIPSNAGVGRYGGKLFTGATVTATSNNVQDCVLCGKSHPSYRCELLKGEPNLRERWALVRKGGLCYKCLRPDCKAAECPREHMNFVCRRCDKPHNKILGCWTKAGPKTSGSDGEDNEAVGFNAVSKLCDVTKDNVPTDEFLMNIIPVCVEGTKAKKSTYGFVDNGSRATILDEAFADEIGVDGERVTRRVSTVTDCRPHEMRAVSFNLANVNNGFTVKVCRDAYIMNGVSLSDQLGLKLPSVELLKYDHLKCIRLPPVDHPVVSVLIGLPVREAHEVVRYHMGGADEPYGIETKLGVAFTGPCRQSDVSATIGCRVTNFRQEVREDVDLNADIRKFCGVEEMGVKYPPVMGYSADEQKAMEMLRQSIHQRSDGHYECRLLWRDPERPLPESREQVLKRFHGLERKFKSDRNYFGMYKEAMDTMILNGWATRVDQTKKPGPRVFYLSHFGVVNDNKPGRVRPVFDLAERHKHGDKERVSLNDLLLCGPDVTSSLFGVLLRGRTSKVCVGSDVCAMFNQCFVSEVDRDSLRFFWYDTEGKLAEYTANVHVFGAASSPYVASAMLKKTAEDHGGEIDVVEAANSSFYVDDSLVCATSSDDALRIADGLKELLGKGGFPLTKFVSNDETLVKNLDPSDLDEASHALLRGEGTASTRELGIIWDLLTDSFGIVLDRSAKPNTMRGMVSMIAKVFDPMGILSPVILAARTLVQDCWKRGCYWDEDLPPDILTKWNTWKRQLPTLETLRIPRQYLTHSSTCYDPDLKLELHAFSDASNLGTGCVIYLRGEDPHGNVQVGFVCAKSRVLPKKPKLTVPRSELKAAVEAVRMVEFVKTELRLELPEDAYHYWTDSELVLRYIANRSDRFHVFVANRQSEIREFSTVNQWKYCPGTLNPGDDASRGVMPTAFCADHRFLCGPDFLTQPKSEWPSQTWQPELGDDDPEVKKICSTGVDIGKGEPNRVLQYIGSRSHWMRTKRVIGWMLRFAENARKPKGEPHIDGNTPFSNEELERAELRIVKLVQMEHFPTELDSLRKRNKVDARSPIADVCPYLDSAGLMRVSGRLSKAKILPYNTKHPVILPSAKSCQTTKSIILHQHNNCTAHGGKDLVLGTLRERFFIVHGATAVKRAVRSCIPCRVRNAQPITQRMGELPEERVAFHEPAFCYTGTDVFGPVYCKERRTRRTYPVKYYGVVFVCMTTGAIHLESIKRLTTDDMVQALCRFVAVRGGVKRIRSDNGTNYVGAQRELGSMIADWNELTLTDAMTVKNIDWAFQTPYASSQSGYWERRVREVKRHLYAIIGKSEVDSDVFRTVLCEISSIMNSAPLCAVSSEPDDLDFITPAHFLYGKAAEVLGPVPTEPNALYRSKWKQAQQLADAYWKRYIRDFVPTLLRRSKWRDSKENVELNDLVVLMDTDLPRLRWRIGRVVATYPGKDELVRSVRVRTKDGEYDRPIQRLGLICKNEMVDDED